MAAMHGMGYRDSLDGINSDSLEQGTQHMTPLGQTKIAKKGDRVSRAPYIIVAECDWTDGEALWLGDVKASRSLLSQHQFDAFVSRKNPAREFQLYDDDGIHYATGFIVTRPDDIGSELDFIPLEDYGAGYGCTEIRYRNKDGEFETL
jgi:hypothetical protein